MTHGDDLRLCSRCDHPKLEHNEIGCLRTNRLPKHPQAQPDVPEFQLCSCEGFQARVGKFEQV